jgi:hypothetical protein
MTDYGIRPFTSERTKRLLDYFAVALDCSAPVLESLFFSCLAETKIVNTDRSCFLPFVIQTLVVEKAKDHGWVCAENRQTVLHMGGWRLDVAARLDNPAVTINLVGPTGWVVDITRLSCIGRMSYTTEDEVDSPVSYGLSDHLFDCYLSRVEDIVKGIIIK